MNNNPATASAVAAGGQQREWLLQRHNYLGGFSYLLPLSDSEPETCDDLISLGYFGTSITGSSCGGLLYFDDHEDNMVICNPKTKDIKLLPPCPGPPHTYFTDFAASAFGYDPNSDDYKVVKYLFHYYGDAKDYSCRTSERFQLYSLRSDSWKEIPLPPHMSKIASDSVYVGGISYWRRLLGPHLYGDVLWFDFATQISSSFSLPPVPPEPGLVMDFRLVEFHGLLGAIAFELPSRPTICRSKRSFQLWERRRGWWAKVFDASISDDALTPIGLKDGRFLLLEGRTIDDDPKLCQLLIYDWITKELKETDIYDHPMKMKLYSYVETTDPLPSKTSYIHMEVQDRMEVRDRGSRHHLL